MEGVISAQSPDFFVLDWSWMLQMAGFALDREFRLQFTKIMLFIKDRYIPQLVSVKCAPSMVSSLRDLVASYFEQGGVRPHSDQGKKYPSGVGVVARALFFPDCVEQSSL